MQCNFSGHLVERNETIIKLLAENTIHGSLENKELIQTI